MTLVSLFLLTIAAIFLLGIVGELVFERTGIPDVLWLMLLGLVIGPATGLVDREQLAAIAPYFGALTLVVVLFDGGSELRLGDLTQAAGRGTLVAVLGFVASIVVLAPISMLASLVGILPDEWTWLHGIILGTILGGSSSVVIMPALRKAGLAPRLANILNVDSAVTDVLCVVATAACVDIAISGQSGAGLAAAALAKSFGIGLGIGATVGLVSILLLRQIKRSHFAYPLILGTLLLLYVLISELGGSAALGILAVAVMVGNAPQISKVVGLAKSASLSKGVHNVHDQITFIIKSFFFTFIGAMLGPPLGLVAFGVMLGLLLLAARVPAVFVSLAGSGLSPPAKAITAVCLPRGMAAGVLAMFPAQAGVAGTEQLPVVVFATVLTTILLFSIGFPLLRRQLALRDPASLVATPPAAHALAIAADGGGHAAQTLVDDTASRSVDPMGHTIIQPAADATSPEQAIPLVGGPKRD